jgi:hypothetical protein
LRPFAETVRGFGYLPPYLGPPRPSSRRLHRRSLHKGSHGDRTSRRRPRVGVDLVQIEIYAPCGYSQKNSKRLSFVIPRTPPAWSKFQGGAETRHTGPSYHKIGLNLLSLRHDSLQRCLRSTANDFENVHEFVHQRSGKARRSAEGRNPYTGPSRSLRAPRLASDLTNPRNE